MAAFTVPYVPYRTVRKKRREVFFTISVDVVGTLYTYVKRAYIRGFMIAEILDHLLLLRRGKFITISGDVVHTLYFLTGGLGDITSFVIRKQIPFSPPAFLILAVASVLYNWLPYLASF